MCESNVTNCHCMYLEQANAVVDTRPNGERARIMWKECMGWRRVRTGAGRQKESSHEYAYRVSREQAVLGAVWASRIWIRSTQTGGRGAAAGQGAVHSSRAMVHEGRHKPASRSAGLLVWLECMRISMVPGAKLGWCVGMMKRGGEGAVGLATPTWWQLRAGTRLCEQGRGREKEKSCTCCNSVHSSLTISSP